MEVPIDYGKVINNCIGLKKKHFQTSGSGEVFFFGLYACQKNSEISTLIVLTDLKGGLCRCLFKFMNLYFAPSPAAVRMPKP